MRYSYCPVQFMRAEYGEPLISTTALMENNFGANNHGLISSDVSQVTSDAVPPTTLQGKPPTHWPSNIEQGKPPH